MLFGVEAISYRLEDSGARALITNAQGLAKLADIRRRAARAGALGRRPGDGADGFFETLARASPEFAPVDTAADDPALMIYTSGTTGPPKGALHAHRVLLGHLPGIELPHEFLPQPGDRFWTPADWAWAGGLLNVLLPGLHYGVPVVARAVREVRSGGGVRPDGADWRCATPSSRRPRCACCARRRDPRGRHDIALRTVGSGGEALGAETYEWGQLGARPHHQRVLRPDRMQPGARLLRGDRRVAARRDRQAGARPHRRGDPPGRPRLRGRASSARSPIKRPDPVMFLEYWGKPDATREKFIGDWMTTGDQGIVDDDGYSSSSAATTTSSPRRAIASGRARSRTA